MNLKGLLPQDVEMLKELVFRLVDDVSVGDMEMDKVVERLVRCSLGRIAANRLREEYPKLPGEGWHSAMPTAREEIHVMDFIISSFVEGDGGAAWLSNTDAEGRPKKLMKCRSYDDLIREADKYFDKRNGGPRTKIGPDDEEHVAELGSGYTLVRMLTPEALDMESAHMHHCIGHGAYDGLLKAGWRQFLSVRDRKGRPVATIELRQEPNAKWSLEQLSGKRNVRPQREIMDVVRAYAVTDGWMYLDIWWPMVEAKDGTVYDVDKIPAGAAILDINIDTATLEMYPDIILPAGLTVLGNMIMPPEVKLPENLTVEGVLQFSRWFEGAPLIVLPESLICDDIRVSAPSDIARPIPTHLVPRIKCRIRKLTGRDFDSMKWIEEERGLDDEDESEGPSGVRP